jgi:hypothetical protein
MINIEHSPEQRLEFVQRMQQLLPYRHINKDQLAQQLIHLPALAEQVLP